MGTERLSRHCYRHRMRALAGVLAFLAPSALTGAVAAKESPGPTHHKLQWTPKEHPRPLDKAPSPELNEIGRFRTELGKDTLVSISRFTGGAQMLTGFQTAPRSDAPEIVARDFLLRWRRLLRLDPELVELEHRGTRRFVTFIQVRFQQVFGPAPTRVDVKNAEVLVNLTPSNEVWQVHNTYIPGITVKDPRRFDAATCLGKARQVLGITKLRDKETIALRVLPQASGDRFVWEAIIPAAEPFGTWEVLTDAATDCTVLASQDNVRYAQHAQGRIFDPNPIVSARDRSLRPTKPVPGDVYRTVPLLELTKSDVLTGRYADTAQTEKRARDSSQQFIYSRASQEVSRFAETMAYYHVTRTLRHLEGMALQSLKELGSPHKIDKPFVAPVSVDAFNTVGRCVNQRTSCFVPDQNLVVLGGLGTVPDAEDAHVILHELAHAVLHHRSGSFEGLSPESTALSEGFADYLALAMFAEHGFEPACFAPWDASETRKSPLPCLRRADTPMKFDRMKLMSSVENSHDNSQVWSATLWDIRRVLTPMIGTVKADLLIIEAHSGLPKNASMGYVGQCLLDAQRRLHKGRFFKSIADVLRAREVPFETPW